jgi:FkbM family methyltransferase
MYFGDHFEFDEMHFVRRYLRRGDGFIDGGANIGTYTLLVARVVGPSGRIEAFEPDSVAAERLRENVILNRLSIVRIHEAAISASGGTVHFLQGWDVSNRVASEADLPSETVEVEAVSLDEALDRETTYAMGKLDLEGAEVAALRGAESHLLDANPPVWEVEGYENQLRKFGSSREELLSILERYGYTFFTYDALRSQLRTLDDAQFGPDNLLAVHRSAVGMVLDRLAPERTEYG